MVMRCGHFGQRGSWGLGMGTPQLRYIPQNILIGAVISTAKEEVLTEISKPNPSHPIHRLTAFEYLSLYIQKHIGAVTKNSKLELEDFCFQRIPLQEIGKLLKFYENDMISAGDNNNGHQWITMDNNGPQWITME